MMITTRLKQYFRRERKITIEEMKNHRWSVSWSGGKDSTATIILMHENDIPIQDINYVRMMYDENIPATLPIMTEFVDRAIKTFEQWGYKVNVIKSKHTAKYYMDKVFFKSMNLSKNGSMYGISAFIRGSCKFQGEKPLAISSIKSSEYEMIGYACDENERLERLTDKKCSIMYELGVKELDTFDICRKYQLLSPLYELGMKRDGCWFCPNASKHERDYIRKHYPELVELINQSINQCSFDLSPLSSRNNWLRDSFKNIDWIQMDIFDYL